MKFINTFFFRAAVCLMIMTISCEKTDEKPACAGCDECNPIIANAFDYLGQFVALKETNDTIFFIACTDIFNSSERCAIILCERPNPGLIETWSETGNFPVRFSGYLKKDPEGTEYDYEFYPLGVHELKHRYYLGGATITRF
jgi:hypothetical protein